MSASANKVVDTDYSSSDDQVSSVSICSVSGSGSKEHADIQSSSGEFKRVTCFVAERAISLTVDLGSKVSIISKSFFDRNLADFQLQPTEVTLKAYNKQAIPCAGCIYVPVRFQDIQKTNFRFFITVQGDSLMGVDLFDALGGAVTLGSTVIGRQPSSSAIAAVSSDVISSTWPPTSVSLTQFPVLLKSSGQLRGFIHKPRVDLSVKPLQQKFWQPPLAMREPISGVVRIIYLGGLSPRLWRARLARAYTGVWGDAPVGSRGKAPGQGVRGTSSPETENILVNECYISAGKELLCLQN